jgi:TatD DNase family protein
MRGQRNEPLHVAEAVEAIAAARGIPFAEAAAATTANAERVFGVNVAREAAVAGW